MRKLVPASRSPLPWPQDSCWACPAAMASLRTQSLSLCQLLPCRSMTTHKCCFEGHHYPNLPCTEDEKASHHPYCASTFMSHRTPISTAFLHDKGGIKKEFLMHIVGLIDYFGIVLIYCCCWVCLHPVPSTLSPLPRILLKAKMFFQAKNLSLG